MLYVTMKNTPQDERRVIITPGNPEEIPGLQQMLRHSFMIENPAKTFADAHKSGKFDGIPESDIAFFAKYCCEASDAWAAEQNGETILSAVENVIHVLGNLMRMYVDVKIENENLHEDYERLLNETIANAQEQQEQERMRAGD